MTVSAEPLLRLTAFAGVFALMIIWEMAAPRRPLVQERRQRWVGNLGVFVIDTAAVRVLFPAATVGVALLAEERRWGLFNQLDTHPWMAVLASVILLDLVVYAQHVAFHRVPWLWRLHRMHHADIDVDVTTGLRFHPIEILLSMLIKTAVVIGLGTPALAVLMSEVALNASSMFTHGNVRLGARTDQVLRHLLVTPDMHRVHHSVRRHETDSNFGFNLSLWDRIFRTYRAAPEQGHQAMALGLDRFREPGELRLDRLLLQPFRES